MKRRMFKCRNKRSRITHTSEGGKDGDNDDNNSPTIMLDKVLEVKVECEGIEEDPGVLLDSVEHVVEAPWEEIPTPADLVTQPPCVADLTSHFNEIFVQTTFDSFQEFEKLFNKFKAETGSVFRIKSSCSTAYENSRRRKQLIPSRFKFVTANYCCVHYGQPKVAGQGIRTKRRYLPCGCESILSLSYNRGALVISQVNMRHNHEVSSKMAPHYSINRRISNTELKEVAGAVETIPNSRALQHFLQLHFHRPLTLQDAKNVRTRLKALKASLATQARSQPSKELRTPLFEDEDEEEEDEHEDVVMDSIDEGVDFRMHNDGEVRPKNNESHHWKESIVLKGSKKQQQHEQDWVAVHVIGEQQEEEEENEKQENNLDSSMKRKVLSELKNRLFGVMENCNFRDFQERVSVLERLIDGWENGDPVQIQYYTDESDFDDKGFDLLNGHSTSTNTPLSQEKTVIKNTKTDTSYSSVDSVKHSEEPQFFPIHVIEHLALDEPDNEVKITSFIEESNGTNSSISKRKSRHGNSNHHKTFTNHSMGLFKKLRNVKGPVIHPVMKGFTAGHEQAMEVLIEVDEDVAEVKAVRREPLDYFEVNVCD